MAEELEDASMEEDVSAEEDDLASRAGDGSVGAVAFPDNGPIVLPDGRPVA